MYRLSAQRKGSNCRLSLTNGRGMDATWFDLGNDEGVLELPKLSEAPALELHVVVTSEGTTARWERELSAWLIAARVGLG